MQTYVSSRSSFLGLQPTLAWTAILGLLGFSLLCFVVHAGGVLRLAYPMGTLVVGILLYQRYPILYIGYAWWIAFLSPFLRRLVDFQSGWLDPNPVMLAPFLVMLVTAMTFLQHFPRVYRRDGLPFVLAAIAVLYGFLVGLVKSPPVAVLVPLLNWLAPVLFGFHLFANWRQYPEYRQNTQRTFIWMVLITGVYGIVQYLVAPPWDGLWLTNSQSIAFGSPVPLGMRVFSTMNSPGPFATVMMAGLVLLLTSHSSIRFAAAGVGYLAFLLTLVRSSWLGWMVAVMTFVPALKPRLQMRLIITILVMAVAVIPLVSLQPFSTAIAARFGSFSNAQEDVSFNARMAGYDEILGEALTEIPGQGLGFVLVSDHLGSNDSGILTILFSLGWLGTLPYLGGILLLILSLFQIAEAASDPFIGAARAISLGVFVQIGLGNPTIALSGVVFWGFAGMALAAQRYYRWQRQQEA
jgi:hypothetical protein